MLHQLPLWCHCTMAAAILAPEGKRGAISKDKCLHTWGGALTTNTHIGCMRGLGLMNYVGICLSCRKMLSKSEQNVVLEGIVQSNDKNKQKVYNLLISEPWALIYCSKVVYTHLGSPKHFVTWLQGSILDDYAPYVQC